jgi:glycine betaine monooxygenase A
MIGVAQVIDRQRDGFTLDAELYHAPAVFAAELAQISRRHWLFAGHGCEIPKPGDFFTWQVGADPLIVLRAEDGAVRALHNVCRHRGSLVCERAQGHAARLVCPYHAWTYGLDGRLLQAPGSSGLDRSRFGLKRLHAEEVCGLIFVHLAERPEPIAALRAHFEPILGPQRLERAKVAKVVDYDLAVNWKTVVENNRECLHCPANHRLYVSVTYDVDNHDPSKAAEIEARVAECQERWAALGLDVARVNTSSDATAPWFRANRTPVRAGFVTESRDGRPVAPLMADFTDPDMGTARANTNVNFWCHANSDYANTVRITPLAPERTLVRAWWLVRADAIEGRDYHLERLVEVHATTMAEDWTICRRVAAGIRSTAYQPGPLSPDREQNVLGFLSWYLRTMRATGEP